LIILYISDHREKTEGPNK